MIIQTEHIQLSKNDKLTPAKGRCSIRFSLYTTENLNDPYQLMMMVSGIGSNITLHEISSDELREISRVTSELADALDLSKK